VIAFARFRNRIIGIDLAREALNDLLELNRPPVSIEQIQRIVADQYKIKVADMYSKRRPAHIALARQVAMYFAKEITQKSFPEIGEAFGGRDHTTVMHAVKKIAELRQKDSEENRKLHVLEQSLRA
jgi:chromosomal replication initiator protein